MFEQPGTPIPFFHSKRTLLVLFCVLCQIIGLYSQNEPHVGLKDRIIRVKGDHYYPPFEFVNDQGEPDGFNVDLFKAMAKMLGIRFTLELGPWATVRSELEKGEIDLLMGVLVSGERSEKILFGTPHSVMTHGIFTRKGSPYRSLSDLKGKEIVVQKSDLIHDILNRTKLASRIIPVKDQLDALKLIASGQHDAAIVGNFQGTHLIRQHNIKNVVIRSSNIEPQKYAMAVSKDNEELLWLINMGLYQLKASGEYQKIHEKWFSVYEKHSFLKKYGPWMLGGGCLVVGLFVFNLLLRFRIRRATKQLKISKEKAEESDQLKTAFLNNISHEVRTPLNGIIGFTNLISETGTSPQNRKRYAEIVDQCSTQLINIITDIITISSLEKGQEKVSLSETNVNILLEELDAGFRHRINLKPIDFTCNSTIPYDEAFVLTDKDKLIRILHHLTDNAFKFTTKGFINVTCKRNQAFLVFTVEDTGVGVPEELRSLIFERFRQATSGDIRNRGGNGLGLAIAKAFVVMLGGEIFLDSTEGAGSSFQFTIAYKPLKQSFNIPVPQPESEQISAEKKSPVILIAEDDYNNYLLIKTILLGTFGELILIHATNGQEAVEAVRHHPAISLVLMDMKMPVMDGFEASQCIKAQNQHLPIIALTAYALSGDREKALSAGCSEYIPKPIHKERMIAMIKRYLT